MRIKLFVNLGVLASTIAAFLAVSSVNLSSQQALRSVSTTTTSAAWSLAQRAGGRGLGDRGNHGTSH